MNLRSLWICQFSSIAVLACSSSATDFSSNPTEAAKGSAGAPSTVPGTAITYWQDVRPLLEEKCTSCHIAEGIAPIALDNYDSAKAFGPLAVAETTAGIMPPWPPGPLSPPMEHDRSLSDAQIQLLADWVRLGSLEGDPSAPAELVPGYAPVLPSVDISGDIGVDYVPASGVTDEYRCFMVELGTTEERVSVGYRVTPGNPKSVHHVITTLMAGDSRDALQALDAETPDVAGWPCAGGPIPFSDASKITSVGSLGTWVPGVSTVLYPEGTGSPVPSGSIAVMQVHYNIEGEPSADRTKIEVALAPVGEEPALKLTTLAIRNREMRIPPGEKDIVVETTRKLRELSVARLFPEGRATLRMVAGHMHMVGVQTSLTLRRSTGETSVLLDIPAWDFHWQGSYTLQTPIELEADDEVTLRCVYDNTPEHLSAVNYPEPARLVTVGEGSTDEMCIGYLTLTR